MSKKYTEEDIRKAFNAGVECRSLNNVIYGDKAHKYVLKLNDKGGSIKLSEEEFAFQFKFLDMKIDWEELHKIIGVAYYNKIYVEPLEFFKIPESICRKYNLI